eukprot:2202718-Prymnesium_polylepis.2
MMKKTNCRDAEMTRASVRVRVRVRERMKARVGRRRAGRRVEPKGWVGADLAEAALHLVGGEQRLEEATDERGDEE